jgi:hypothetical protein
VGFQQSKSRRFSIEDLEGRPKKRTDVTAFRLSRDGKHLAAISVAGGDQPHYQLDLFEVTTGKALVRRSLTGDWFNSRFSPDALAVSVDTDDTLKIQDVRTGRGLAAIPGSVGRSVVFSPDGSLVAVAIIKPIRDVPGQNAWQVLGIRVAEVASGKEVFHADGSFHRFFDFSSDGRLLAACDAEGLGVWDVLTGKRLLKRAWPEGFWNPNGFPPLVSFVFVPKRNAVATGMMDGTILVWDLFPETWPQRDTPKEIGPKELDAYWADLADDEASKAYRAITILPESPGKCVPFFKDHLKPAAESDPKQVQRLLADLDSDQFATREEAAKELAKLGERIHPALRKVLDGQPSEEVRTRVKAILEEPAVPSGETLRTLRAIQVLERIGTHDARGLLKKLAEGAEGARETQEAKDALAHLSPRETAPKP